MGKKKHEKKKAVPSKKQSISYKQNIIVKCHEGLNHEIIHGTKGAFQSFLENWSKSKRVHDLTDRRKDKWVKEMGEKKKEQLDYEIRTEGFEMILLALQHITQRIKKGERCVATIQYDPNAPFTKIMTVIERSDKKSDPGKDF